MRHWLTYTRQPVQMQSLGHTVLLPLRSYEQSRHCPSTIHCGRGSRRPQQFSMSWKKIEQLQSCPIQLLAQRAQTVVICTNLRYECVPCRVSSMAEIQVTD